MGYSATPLMIQAMKQRKHTPACTRLWLPLQSVIASYMYPYTPHILLSASYIFCGLNLYRRGPRQTLQGVTAFPGFHIKL